MVGPLFRAGRATPPTLCSESGESIHDFTNISPDTFRDEPFIHDPAVSIDRQRAGGRPDRLRRRPGVILATVGVFQFFQGLAAIVKGSFFVVAPNNIYELSVSGWGWIHLILGIVLAATGFFILTGQPWARVVGIGVAGLSALANFLFIPYYPLWALVIIALDVAVIWALATYRPQD